MNANGATANADSFGVGPSAPSLASYTPDRDRGDIYADALPEIAARWDSFAAGIAGPAGVQGYLDRHVEDLGLGFRIAGDEHERAWPLNAMPIIIGAEEWRRIEEGLIQRARLIEQLLADIYGEQRLVSEGLLPASVISGSRDFLPRMMGLTPPSGQYLYVYGVDLARGPTGEWRVLSDRVRLPVGIGYALENRIALARGTGSLMASIGTKRLDGFFEAIRSGIAARCAREDPRIALLTPGRFNQSYPEQAHLARYLGFSLVEGRDLLVRDQKLYVRTIGGLKRVDALWRWMNARSLDPLAFDSKSEIGVPGIFSAWTGSGLVTANWPGAGVVEARAMSAFLPRLSHTLFGEPLKLPNLATWWCGQDSECEYVLANLDNLMLSSSFRTTPEGLEDGRTRAGASFTGAERDRLLDAIRRRPMDYAGQEIVRLSTTPCFLDGHFEPRAFTIRTFLVRDAQGNWNIMPGGFARVSQQGDLRTSLMAEGDLSADVCIVEDTSGPDVVDPPALIPPPIRRAAGELPSQAADNLFWLGRYGERAEMTARVVRTLLATTGAPRAGGSTVLARLGGLLSGWSAASAAGGAPEALAATALGETKHNGSVVSLVTSVRQVARLLRDRLTLDSWRVINRPMPAYHSNDSDSMAEAADRLIERFATLAGLTAESMTRTPAWRFLDMGLRIERASLTVQAAMSMIPGSASADDLAALLELFDCQYLYRSRYLAIPFIAPVLDMVLLDPDQPRSLAFQVARLVEHIATLPVLSADGMPEPPLRQVQQIQSRIAALDAARIDHATLAGLRGALFALSDAIAQRYFLKIDRAEAKPAIR